MLYRNNVMASSAEKAGDPITDGVDGLVPVAAARIRTQNFTDAEIQAADVGKGIVYPVQLKLKLLLIVHVHQCAAAALSKNRAGRLDSVGRRLQQFHSAGING